MEEAGVPEEMSFKTKPQLAREMLERALEAEVPCGWVCGDSVYGKDRKLRMFSEEEKQPFVPGACSNEQLWVVGPTYYRAAEIVAELKPEDWERLSAGEGSKGPRFYDWALQELWRLQLTEEERQWGHYLLVRRSISDPEELAFFVVYAPRADAELKKLAEVAGKAVADRASLP